MPQTVYALDPAVGLSGQAVRIDSADSGSCQDVAGLNEGRFVKLGTNTTFQNKTFSALALVTDTNPCGVSILREIAEPKNPRFAQFDEMAVLRKGRIWMTCVGDIAAGERPFIVYTGANAGLPSHTNTNAFQSDGVECIEGASDGQLGLFEVNIPF